LFSTYCRKLREAKEKGVPNTSAVKTGDPESKGNWFASAISKLSKKGAKLGDPSAKETAAKGVPKKKFDDCVDDVSKKAGIDNAYAVCNWSLGRKYSEYVKQAGISKPTRGGQPKKHKTKYPKTMYIVQSAGKLMGSGLKGVKKEADSSTAFPLTQVPRKTKETAIKFNTVGFRERAANKGDADFDVTLIEEGLGNFHDAFYYTREALESAVEIFNGMKAYADHPKASEKDDRPERTVRDIIGHYEALEIRENEGECAELCGKIDVLSSSRWATDLIVRAIENKEKFPEKPFIGFSINASGDAEEMPIDEVLKMAPAGAKPKLEEAKSNGIDTVKVVRKIKSAVSCDLVTEAGAGGKANKNLNEREKNINERTKKAS